METIKVYRVFQDHLNFLLKSFSYHPDDLLSEEAFDLAAFCDNVCMEECRVKVFAGEYGPDYEVI